MIYIIISNIGLAIMTIVMFLRYSHFRISSNLKIRDLEKNLQAQKDAATKLEEKLRAEAKSESDQVKKVLRELEQSRKERQEEIRLRLEAEKEIELALQKMQEIQARMNDWKRLQDAAAVDSKETILKIGNDLFAKISKNYKEEAQESKSAIDKTAKNVYTYLENIAKTVETLRIAGKDAGAKVEKAVSSVSNSMVKAAPIQLDDDTKKAINEVVSLAKVSGLEENKNYIVAANLDENKSKFMLCDLAILSDKILYLVDFKAIRYFKSYDKAKDKKAALTLLKPSLDKYIDYISNSKYKSAIEKLVAGMKMKYSDVKIVFAVRNHDDTVVIKDIKYNEKISKLKLTVLDVNGVNDLIL